MATAWGSRHFGSRRIAVAQHAHRETEFIDRGVDFVALDIPKGVSELLVTGPKSIAIAGLDVLAGSLETVAQRYERRGGTTYWYSAPRFDYQALLEVDAAGFIRLYPGLWEAEP